MFEKWLTPQYLQFSSLLNRGFSSGSLIISGDSGLGTAQLALECAKLYLCQDRMESSACCRCKSCLAFAQSDENASHPDVLCLLAVSAAKADSDDELTHDFAAFIDNMENREDGAVSVRVDGVRRLCEWISQGNVMGYGKVAIVSNADLMNESAANALLKTFEEPPSNTLVILLTRSLDCLPATILSRACKLQVPPVASSDALEYIRGHLNSDYNEARCRVCLSISHGSPKKALKYYESGFDELAVSLVKSICANVCGKSGVLEFIDIIKKMPDELVSAVLSEFILQVLKYKAGFKEGDLPLISDGDLDVLGNIPAEKLFNAQKNIGYFSTSVINNTLPTKAPTSQMQSWLGLLMQSKD
ncbi:MAG: hypothetical protein ACI4NE_00130 [Succinivibrio sp.]